MAPPIQRGLGIVGLSKQAAKGTPDAQPDFVFGISSGGMFQVELDQSPEDVTLDAVRLSPDANRMSVVPGQSYKTRAYPKSIGLLCYSALGGIADSGTTPNFTHTITPASDVPYLTGWGKFGGSLYSVQDAKCDELTLTWKDAGPLEVDYSIVGTVIAFPASITPVVDDSQSNYFRAAGGTFKMDAGSATAAVAPIKGGNVKIANGVAPVILSRSVVPDDVAVAQQQITCGLTLVIQNLDEWRKIVTGSAAGTTPSQVTVWGSLDVLFSIDASTSLQIASTRVAFTGDFPDADPKGGPTEWDVTGTIHHPTSGSALTIVSKNATASY